MCKQSKIKKTILYDAKLTDQLPFQSKFQKSEETYREQMVHQWRQRPQE